MARSVLHDYYENEVIPALTKSREFKNPMQVPRLEKIVINSGVAATKGKDVLQETVDTLTAISGQKAVVTKARQSISNFKLREGMPVGARVTLRKEIMWNFLHRLVNVVLPRVRDFRGISGKAFDGAGNYNMGLSDQSVFTEVNLDKVKNTIGMNICIVTTAGSDEEAKELLSLLGMPFSN